RSLAICPILKRRRLVGMLILEEHDRFREWIVPECEVLRIAGALIGATFERMENDFISQQYTLQLAEKSHELALKNIDLQERSAYIENLLERKKEMTIQIGHDLRTPLTPIIGLIPLILKTEKNPENREMLIRIEQGASRIRLLLDKILTLQQMDTVQPDEKNGCTDLGSLVQMVITRYQDQVTQKEITVTTEVPGSLYASIPDKSLFLVIEELMRNAIRYSDPGGAISVSGGYEANLIWLCISDTGIGLTKTDKERVLDYFYKSDLSRHEIDTHGLGLPIVQHILEKYQGTISMESEGRGTGSRFCITLPVAGDPGHEVSGKNEAGGISE
ncbi:MAG: HAMP domain-containing histidine kinase, partial [Methanospirillum sp.]|uniref:sensor histidine kinase n=1 Tax=Methanospirillum sp. TaxID=45200 RepID=UPI00236AFA09